MSRQFLPAAVAALLCVSAPASADLSRGVITAFRGQLIVSKDELPDGKGGADGNDAKADKEAIAKIKGVHLKELTGTKNEDLTYWHFHYTAFLTKTGNSALKLEFLKNGKLAANQSLNGIDTKSPVLSGDVSINEDEGIAKGNTYTVQLLTANNAVVAKTTLTMK